MDKPINQIINIKSYDQLKNYLHQRPNLNLGIMMDKNGTTLMHFSAFKNDLLKMKTFVRHYKQFTLMNHGTGLYTGSATFTDKLKAWINSPNNQGYLPIHYAALHGNMEMIKFLEELGSNMLYKTSKDENILFMATENNHITVLIYLIQSEHNFDVNFVNCRQQTILHVAALKGYLDTISYLLTVGADIQAKDMNNSTPLITSVFENKKQVVKLLLIKGADRTATNKDNLTALQIAQKQNNQEIRKILDNNYSTWQKIKIKCNKKVVYEPQPQSYLYSLFFMFLFHLFFLPVNILTQFKTDEKYIAYVPFIGEGIYEVLVIGFFLALLKKFRRRPPLNLLEVKRPFCSECRRKMSKKAFHCHICARCVYRYDHHCPWINNCVGSHNIGKFTFFLFLLILGLSQVIFCSVCLFTKNNPFVKYRDWFDIPNGLHVTINLLTIIFSFILLLALLSLFKDQLYNLFTNTTSFERHKNKVKEMKKSTLLSDSNLNQSINSQNPYEDQQQSPSCFRNIIHMLSEPS